MSIARLDFRGAPATASIVAQWLKEAEDEPLWLIWAAFARVVPQADQLRIWKAAMGVYSGAGERNEVLHVGA